MKIYVDFDDCLCETARYFSRLVAKLYGKNVPYEKINFFNLQDSFSLTDEQYNQIMVEGHRPEVLLAFEETPGASVIINSWLEKGYDVSVITGRPFSAYSPSREWLDVHGMERVKLYCLDKYGREGVMQNGTFSLKIEDYYKMHFDFAVEDSPHAFRFFEHLPKLKVLVYDRPWNRACEFPGENYHRAQNWNVIKDMVG